MKTWTRIPVCVAIVAGVCLSAGAAENLVKNPGFEMKDGRLDGWTDRTATKQKLSNDADAGNPQGKPALRVDVTADGGSSSHGQILQTIAVKGNTAYKLEMDVKASRERMAYVQIKLMEGKSETTRLVTEANAGANSWETQSKEFTTAPGTTGVQVICRFRMSSGYVNRTAWFANPRLAEAAGEATSQPAASQPAESTSTKPFALKQEEPKVTETGKDAYVTPEGAGAKDGSDWANALAGNDGGLQKAWDLAGPGNTVHVGGGVYKNPSVTLTAGGAGLDRPKSLVGVDRGGSRPVFLGTWTKDKPSAGSALMVIPAGVSFVEIRNLEVRGYKTVLSARGRNHGLRIAKVDVQDSRDAFWFEGGATTEEPDAGSSDIVLRDSTITRYTKRGVRILEGVSRMRVINVTVDAGGKDYAAEVFPMGFAVQGNAHSKAKGVADRDIVFVNCEARGNYHDAGADKYWNADGFCAESNTYNLTYVNCRAFDNTDGGWDIKSKNAVLIDCVSARNKRNFRFWSEAVMVRCTGQDAVKRGGTGTAAGLHVVRGSVYVYGSTFRNNPIGVDIDTPYTKPVTVTLTDCTVVPGNGKAESATVEDGGVLRVIGGSVPGAGSTEAKK